MAFVYNMTDTWGDGGTLFTAIKMSVTDSASDAGSNLLDLLVGGASKFTVDKNGNIDVVGTIANHIIGTDIQAYDAGLAYLDGLNFTNEATFKQGVNLEIGVDVQAYDALLNSLAGLTTSQGGLAYFTASDTAAHLAKGTAGQVLTMNTGATAPEWADAAGGVGSSLDTQTFTSSGTWTKPSSGSLAIVTMWGGGGSGAKESTSGDVGLGGGGGGCARYVIPLSELGATETVTIGAGGASRTIDQSGADGGDTYFGSYRVNGGRGGRNAGSVSVLDPSAGGGQDAEFDRAAVINTASMMPTWAGGMSGFGGGGNTSAGQSSVWGGGGGGMGGDTSTLGGTSVFGGDGGRGYTGATAGVAGTQPGGGGGGSDTGASGAGGAGKVTVVVY